MGETGNEVYVVRRSGRFRVTVNLEEILQDGDAGRRPSIAPVLLDYRALADAVAKAADEILAAAWRQHDG